MLSRLLILSSSLLWYPIVLLGGVKTHHVIIIILALTTCLSGNLINHIYLTFKRYPFLIMGMFGWVLVLSVTTLLADTSWSLTKVISFFLQILIGNYAVTVVMADSGLDGLKKLLNFSLIFFLIPIIFFSGIPTIDVIEIVYRTIVQANPKIIIFEFLAKAPLFLSFDADGLDGLRHTISLYLVLVFLVNLFANKKNWFDFLIIVFVIFIIVTLQSRAAWLALLPSIAVYMFFQVFVGRRSAMVWFVLVVFVLLVVIVAITILGPLIVSRLTHVDSYGERMYRFHDAWNWFADLSFSPITMNRMYGSSHTFIFDSYYSGGILGFILSAVIIFTVVATSFPHTRARFEFRYLIFIFAFPLIVRMLTAGSGLPGFGATLCFSVALYLAMHRRKVYCT